MPTRNRSKSPAVGGSITDGVISSIRGERAILDADLAGIYGVTTKALNQAVKRNRERFPPDFLLQLTHREFLAMNRSQIVTGSTFSRARCEGTLIFANPH